MTKLKIGLLFVCLIFVAATAGAQTKISGTIQCAKAESQNAIPVNDRPGHVFVIMKVKCTWTKPMDIAGAQSKTGEDTVFSEVNGPRGRDSGVHITTMASGDQFVVRFNGSSTTDKDGNVLSQSGTWSFQSGTGKLKGITGKGTYKGKGAGDGSVATDVEGAYQIAGK